MPPPSLLVLWLKVLTSLFNNAYHKLFMIITGNFIHELLFPMCVSMLLYIGAHIAVVPHKRFVSSVAFMIHKCAHVFSLAWAPSSKSKLYFTFPWHSGEWFAQPSLPLKVCLIEILSPFPNARTGIKDSNCNVYLCIPSICEFTFKTKCDAVLCLLYQWNPNQCLTLRLPTALCLSGHGGRGY